MVEREEQEGKGGKREDEKKRMEKKSGGWKMKKSALEGRRTKIYQLIVGNWNEKNCEQISKISICRINQYVKNEYIVLATASSKRY